MTIRFSIRELLDFGAAWIALSVAFTIFFERNLARLTDPSVAIRLLTLSLVTVGVGFLLHELAHKVVAVKFGKIAAFRADYGMLFIAIVSAMVGFIFAAPGAVYHRGRATARENALIALAGPITNLVLAAVFAPLAFLTSGFVGQIGALGLSINLILAAFNMIPFGPLDGATVLKWNKVVFGAVFLPSVALAVYALFVVGIGI